MLPAPHLATRLPLPASTTAHRQTRAHCDFLMPALLSSTTSLLGTVHPDGYLSQLSVKVTFLGRLPEEINVRNIVSTLLTTHYIYVLTKYQPIHIAISIPHELGIHAYPILQLDPQATTVDDAMVRLTAHEQDAVRKFPLMISLTKYQSLIQQYSDSRLHCSSPNPSLHSPPYLIPVPRYQRLDQALLLNCGMDDPPPSGGFSRVGLGSRCVLDCICRCSSRLPRR